MIHRHKWIQFYGAVENGSPNYRLCNKCSKLQVAKYSIEFGRHYWRRVPRA